jgi:hypothetical protein
MRSRLLAIAALAALAVAASAAVAIYSAVEHRDVGVVDRYAEQVPAKPQSPTAHAEQARLDARMLGNVLAQVDAIEAEMRTMNEEYLVSKNANEGVYTVEQEEHIADAYDRYLVLRKALFHIAFRHKDFAEFDDRDLQDQSFLLAYAAGLTLYRNAVIFVMLFKDQPNARKKLNEANPMVGTPAGMFDEMYANVTSRENVQLVIDGLEEFERRKPRLRESELIRENEGLSRLIERLEGYEAQLERAYQRLGEAKADVLWTTLKTGVQRPAYETQTMISMMISEIRVPLHAPGFSPKTVQRDIRPMLEPGDILLTRRDGYLSNTFLPGHWGHAALYLGSADDMRALGDDPDLERLLADYDQTDRDGFPIAAIEAIGEGVRFSSAEFAMDANSLAVLRPRVTHEQKRTAIRRAIELRGTPYDFSFDLFSQDKIICTELVYRAYAPHLDVPFEEVMGRKTLKPDGMLRELSPVAAEPRTDFVLFAKAKDGKLDQRSVEQLLATVD